MTIWNRLCSKVLSLARQTTGLSCKARDFPAKNKIRAGDGVPMFFWRKSLGKRGFLNCSVVFLTIFFISCGLDDYYYLPAVPVGTYDSTEAKINIPNYNSYSYFHNFRIFYRIYISGETLNTRIDETNMSSISSSLSSDYNNIKPNTDTTSTTVNTSIGSMFTTRKYYELVLENTDINGVLGSSSFGSEIVFDFSSDGSGSIPTMQINNGTEYALYRSIGSTGESGFDPEPDRFFRNSPDICLSANAIARINADVADAASTTPETPRYTYASFYIAATGIDPRNLTSVFSKPTHIGIFRLPESNQF